MNENDTIVEDNDTPSPVKVFAKRFARQALIVGGITLAAVAAVGVVFSKSVVGPCPLSTPDMSGDLTASSDDVPVIE